MDVAKIGFLNGGYMQKMRKRAGLTQKSLADIALVSEGTVYLLENDRVNPSIEVVVALADALGISVNEYIGHRPKRERMPDGLKKYFDEQKRRKI